jgi:hypothetical protein
MYVLLRLIALILVTIGLLLLGADLVTTLETGKITTRAIGKLWMDFDKLEPQAFFVWLDHHLPSFLASPAKKFFDLWGWAVAGPLGCLLLLIFGRRSGG